MSPYVHYLLDSCEVSKGGLSSQSIGHGTDKPTYNNQNQKSNQFIFVPRCTKVENLVAQKTRKTAFETAVTCKIKLV